MYLPKAAIWWALSCPNGISYSCLLAKVSACFLPDAEVEPVYCPISIFCHPSTHGPWANYNKLLLQENIPLLACPPLLCHPSTWNALVTAQQSLIVLSKSNNSWVSPNATSFVHSMCSCNQYFLEPSTGQDTVTDPKVKWGVEDSVTKWTTSALNTLIL